MINCCQAVAVPQLLSYNAQSDPTTSSLCTKLPPCKDAVRALCNCHLGITLVLGSVAHKIYYNSFYLNCF